LAALIGTANPTPSESPELLRICALMPMTRPRASKSRLAHEDAGRVPERQWDERMPVRIDLQERDVVEEVPADYAGGDTVAVAELDEHLLRRLDIPRLVPAGARHHVGAREDVAVFRHHEPGALPARSARVGLEERVDRHDALGARLVDARRLEARALERLGR
jgi:hypothetical protein